MRKVREVKNSAPQALKLISYGSTDVGMKRRHNEDVFLIDEDLGLYLVADGMGGHASGEVASRIAADTIRNYLEKIQMSNAETWPEHWDSERRASSNLLRDAILSAHQHVMSAVDEDPARRGMGTTVVAALYASTAEPVLTIGHVGDSRAYRLRDGRFEVLTEDHSWVHEQIAAGLLTEEAGRSHPLKNVVTQALGGSAKPDASLLETEMQEGDLYLLCSDGLNTMLEDGEIAGIIKENGTLQELVERLIVAANERGGNDNTTIILLRAMRVAA